MKKNVFTIAVGMFLLTACSRTSYVQTPSVLIRPSTAPSSLPIAAHPTETPSPLPTDTSLPTESSTPSITSLPTIPTFTPTFDASTIVTVTPARPAVCPKENPAIVAKFATPDSYGSYEIYSAEEILDYLNSGGSPGTDFHWGEKIDLTGDGVSEIVYEGRVRYDILGCKDGNYQNLFELATYDFSMELKDISDLNKDGIPELVFYSFSRYGFADIYIIGWDGNRFRSLIDVGTDTYTGMVIDSVSATAHHKLMDANGDGLKEMIVVYDLKELCGGLGGLCDGTLTRKRITTLAWNGQNYVDLTQENYAPPHYRFQAVQDGDWRIRYGNYTAALALYQEAIFNDQLEWWSPEREMYEIHDYWSQYDATPTVYPTPHPDTTEYPRLAAYAYYRIMLLHVVQGHESDAGTIYKTLEQKFSKDPFGRPYYEMATTFWDVYQSTNSTYDGCAAAIQYATEHAEILVPLGSDYHGGYSHTYVPADVCPFR